LFTRLLTFSILIALMFSCGVQNDETIDNAIDQANRLLSKNQCDTAISTLEAIGRQNTNHLYLITLASAYACRGGYNELILFANDFPNISVANALGGFTLFSTSDDMTSPTSSSYTDLNTALEILYSAGGFSVSNPTTSSDRRSIFGTAKGGDIDSFILYMTTVQLGRFLRYYGNIDTTTGSKGGGPGLANCLLNYDGATSMAVTGSISDYLRDEDTGNCVVDDDGNDELGTQYNIDITLACQGVVLLNNFLDVLPAVLDDYAGNELSELGSIKTIMQSAKTILLTELAAGGVGMGSTTSQADCESINSSSSEHLEVYYTVMFETLFL
jgi:hypothetical protein